MENTQNGQNQNTDAGKNTPVQEQNEKTNVNTPQSGGGGASGYDPDKEQQEVNKESEEMHDERNPDELNVEEKPGTTENQSDTKTGQAGTFGIR